MNQCELNQHVIKLALTQISLFNPYREQLQSAIDTLLISKTEEDQNFARKVLLGIIEDSLSI